MRRPRQYFRAGVGAVILDRRGQVLVFERTGMPGAWQFPQGGMDRGETPRAAVVREVAEETGIPRRALRLVARYPQPLAYELPARARTKKTGLGQVQYWFFFLWEGPPGALPSLPREGEFQAAAWVPYGRAVRRVVSFKRPVYEILGRFLRGLQKPQRSLF
jgi:putative (di)nucleoside polyphosphate hydrolase